MTNTKKGERRRARDIMARAVVVSLAVVVTKSIIKARVGAKVNNSHDKSD
jgi:hypothetical protein